MDRVLARKVCNTFLLESERNRYCYKIGDQDGMSVIPSWKKIWRLRSLLYA